MLVVPTLADKVDTVVVVGMACEAGACNRHMVGSRVGTDHGNMVVA